MIINGHELEMILHFNYIRTSLHKKYYICKKCKVEFYIQEDNSLLAANVNTDSKRDDLERFDNMQCEDIILMKVLL